MSILYKIANPSDPYTIEAPDLKTAAVACLILGQGMYAFNPVGDAGEAVPMFAFSGEGAAEEWCMEHFGMGLESLLADVDDLVLADCLDTIVVGDRAAFLSMAELVPEPERDKAWERWHDANRSSLNDIGGAARRYARALREKAVPA